MKGLLRFLAVILILMVGVWGYVTYYMNRGAIEELEAHPEGELAAKTLLLTLPSGRRIPVNYLEDGERVFVAADGPWWRQFRGEGAPVTLLIRGETHTGVGRAVLSDPARIEAVFARLRPNVPDWLPGWLDATLVEIEVDS